MSITKTLLWVAKVLTLICGLCLAGSVYITNTNSLQPISLQKFMTFVVTILGLYLVETSYKQRRSWKHFSKIITFIFIFLGVILLSYIDHLRKIIPEAINMGLFEKHTLSLQMMIIDDLMHACNLAASIILLVAAENIPEKKENRMFFNNRLVISLSNMMNPIHAITLFPEIDTDQIITEPIYRTCMCGKHGMILYRKDENGIIFSGEIRSKAEGHYYADRSLRDQKITKQQADSLRQQISRSPLPD